MNGSEKLLELAKAQIGYQEKAGAAGLDDPDANAGQNNYTKYSRDVDFWGLMGCQGQPWCCTYQFWLEATIFGVEMALEHFCMTRESYTAYHCFSTYQAFERQGRTSSRPQVGALIVFTYEHIGRVTVVKNGRVYTNEGNTSAMYGDSNGGTVKEKSYDLNDPNIKGYCLIDYGEEENLPETESSFAQIKQVALVIWKDILNRLYGKNLSLTGTRFGEECQEAAGSVLIRYGDEGTLVVLAEGFLAEQRFYHGVIDGMFGDGMLKAVRRFQDCNGLEVDGVIGRDTWGALFGN